MCATSPTFCPHTQVLFKNTAQVRRHYHESYFKYFQIKFIYTEGKSLAIKNRIYNFIIYKIYVDKRLQVQ